MIRSKLNNQRKSAVSIIIVHYHVKKELFACIQSITDSKPKTSYEIIIIDNDEIKRIGKELHKMFPKVVYVPNENKGFGQGNNVGAKHAKGDFLFFLNPDTIVFKNTIDVLMAFFEKNKKVGVVAPFLLHANKEPFKQQGMKELTPFRAIFSISVINKFFPNNPVAKNYFIQWDKIKTKMVDVVPGTAFMIKKELYKSLKGFDETFFLYFEEFDLCKRIKERGYQLFIEPDAKIIHLWERSTKQRNDINKIFNQSRFYYFKKHYGIFSAIITNAILNFGRYSFLTLLILILATILLFYKINVFIPFIGDQAWFYLAARDVIFGKSLPLVGIAASHPWLHQGAYWTYMLAFMLWLFHFNPVSGSYLTSVIGIISVYLMYLVGKTYFSNNVGIIAAFLFATSPLVILSDRMAYHTSPIPLFTLYFLFSLYKWIKGNKFFFPLCILLLSVLYNFELATTTLGIIFGLLVLFGLWKRKIWIKNIFDRRILVFSFLAYFIPMFPMILYDTQHGYPQTLKFVAWIGYHVLLLFGFPSIHPGLKQISWNTVFTFSAQKYQMLIFAANGIFALAIAFVTFTTFYYLFFRMIRTKNYHVGMLVVGFMTILLVFGFLANRTTSSAYLPDLFPFIILQVAVVLDMARKKLGTLYIIVLLFIGVLNVYTLLQTNYFTITSYADMVQSAKSIVTEAHGRPYNIKGYGVDGTLSNFTKPYQYLTLWLGHGPSDIPEQLVFYIKEDNKGVHVIKSIKRYE